MNEQGQSTVEFAVIMAGCAIVLVGLSAIWHAFSGGIFISHALLGASHRISGVVPAVLADIFLY